MRVHLYVVPATNLELLLVLFGELESARAKRPP